MEQDEKTIILIKFWKNRAEYYESHHYTADAGRCQRHIGNLRKEYNEN